MRLTKVMDKVAEERVMTDQKDAMGRPIFKTIETLIPVQTEIEPFSKTSAETLLGLVLEVSNRCFCYVNHGLVTGDTVRYKDVDYLVTHILEYDRHNEILINKED